MAVKKQDGSVLEKATFVVKIQHCRNATWQGRLIWADEDKEIPFRSALEMLRLIDSALGDKKN